MDTIFHFSHFSCRRDFLFCILIYISFFITLLAICYCYVFHKSLIFPRRSFLKIQFICTSLCFIRFKQSFKYWLFADVIVTTNRKELSDCEKNNKKKWLYVENYSKSVRFSSGKPASCFVWCSCDTEWIENDAAFNFDGENSSWTFFIWIFVLFYTNKVYVL
jgi:hypothetical protein